MPKVCQITGKKALVGNNVSHAMNKTKRRFEANLIKKRFYLTDQEKWITLKLSTSALKTINTNLQALLVHLVMSQPKTKRTRLIVLN